MIISIHQPQYLPWIPYFTKIFHSDVFVFLDDVQYQKNGMQNRNFILCKNGQTRLTIPVSCRFGDKINEVRISNRDILKKHWQTIQQCYKQSNYYFEVSPVLQKIYQKEYSLLLELNISIITELLGYLSIKTKLLNSSDVIKHGNKSDLILDICEQLGADTYLSGSGGFNYLNFEDFNRAGIKIQVQEYNFKPYSQHNCGDFVDKLSILDLLFNHGKKSLDFL